MDAHAAVQRLPKVSSPRLRIRMLRARTGARPTGTNAWPGRCTGRPGSSSAMTGHWPRCWTRSWRCCPRPGSTPRWPSPASAATAVSTPQPVSWRRPGPCGRPSAVYLRTAPGASVRGPARSGFAQHSSHRPMVCDSPAGVSAGVAAHPASRLSARVRAIGVGRCMSHSQGKRGTQTAPAPSAAQGKSRRGGANCDSAR